MKRRNKKAFTIIELIVVVAILGILVLLGMNNFTGNVKNAKHTKVIVATKTIEDASGMYHMDNNDWPRLTDEPYTKEQLEAFANKFYDNTGKEITLDENGNYYDIDYDKLSQYAKAPENKKDYILQNPVGKIFYMENLNEAGENRVDYVAKKVVNPSTPSKPNISKAGESSILVTAEDGTEVRLNGGTWFTSPHTFDNIEIGQSYLAEVRFKATEDYLASKLTLVNFDTVDSPGGQIYDFAYTGNVQEFTVPAGGQYKLEVWGAQGGYTDIVDNKGGYSKGSLYLQKESIIRIYSGGMGNKTTSRENMVVAGTGGWNGGGDSYSYGGSGGGTSGGGGGTDIRINGSTLYHRVMVAGAGGGAHYNYDTKRSYGGFGGGEKGGYGGANAGRYENEGGGQKDVGLKIAYEGQYYPSIPANFGVGATAGAQYGAGGGGGWYGGNASGHSGAGGGSGYVHTASSYKPAGWQLTEEHYLTDTEMIAGNQSMPNPNGGTMIGNTGHGFARITALNSWKIIEN